MLEYAQIVNLGCFNQIVLTIIMVIKNNNSNVNRGIVSKMDIDKKTSHNQLF